jgi:hypothetical protein
VEQVTVAIERVGDRRRWVQVTMSLCACDPGDPFLSYRDPFAWGLEPADPLSAAYGWRDWQDFLRDALDYVWRPFAAGGVQITGVRGVLGLEDREGLELACVLAMRRLVGDETPEVATREWRVREHQPGALAGG